jgi:hypothetical protein
MIKAVRGDRARELIDRKAFSSWPGRSAKRVFALDVPAIHVFDAWPEDVDARHEAGHDELC